MLLAFIFFTFFNVPKVKAQTATIKVGVTVANPKDFGMTIEEVMAEPPGEIGSVFWQVKQCCMQLNHRLGLQSDYCFKEEIEEKYPYCEAYLK